MATDPVCGMIVDEPTASLRLIREGRTYFFCSTDCLAEFADPMRHRSALLHRIYVVWPLALVILTLVYLGPGRPAQLAALALATVVQFYGGWPFYRGTADAIRSRSWNMDLLVATSTTAAYAYSAAVVLAPGALAPQVFFDASAVIIALILTGHYLEALTRERASGAVRRLRELLPAEARRRTSSGEQLVPLSELRPGDDLLVAPGTRVPADGVVLSGSTSVDESIVTGESVPVIRRTGDRLVGGSLNLEGAIVERTTAVGQDSFVAEVGRLLTEAETSRVPLQRTADRIAAVFVPLVLLLAISAAAGWYLLGGAPGPAALLVFVTVVITACPCAFGIATPAAIVVGTGRAAEDGVLFRGEDAIERTASISTVLADKTGTLTLGSPSVVAVDAAPGTSTLHVLEMAAALESLVRHPFAHAIVAEQSERGGVTPRAQDVVVVPGEGVEGSIDGTAVALWSGPAASRRGVPTEPWMDSIQITPASGVSTVVVVRAGRAVGLIRLSDPIAPGARPAVEELRRRGFEVAMVTGDSEGPARRVATDLGVDEVVSGVSPAGKVAAIKARQQRGERVAFVGDGINDAAALSVADSGMAIGTGTDVAREAGRVLLLRRDLRTVPFAIEIARRTVAKVRQNIAWAIGYNLLLLPVAAGALVPIWGFGVYSVLPIVGAAAMALSSTTVVLNSLSLRRAPRTLPLAPPNSPPPGLPSLAKS